MRSPLTVALGVFGTGDGQERRGVREVDVADKIKSQLAGRAVVGHGWMSKRVEAGQAGRMRSFKRNSVGIAQVLSLCH